MCGIAGKITGGEPVDRNVVAAMCDSLRHRGPDDEGLHVEGSVGLGMRRLSVIDLSAGDQPIYSEDGRVVLVFNGEIYNHREIREELRAKRHEFRGGSDGEVIVHLWEELGPRCLERLRGMFVFAIWDKREELLFLARDRVGKKPLFYSHWLGTLRFASEPRAIFQDGEVPRDVDAAAIDAYLVNQYVPHDRCAYSQLQKLPPACTLAWRPGQEPRVERYWSLDYTTRDVGSSAEAAEQLREMVVTATRLRLMSDVPIGAFLSGGIDSSVVVAAMAMASSQPVRTFSVAFPGWGLDETTHARAVAELYSTDHQELEVRAVDASLLPRLTWHFGEPFADPAALPTYQLAELTHRHVTVALNGDGGDESFAGYRRYWRFLATRPADALPAGLRTTFAARLNALAATGNVRAPLDRAAQVTAKLALPPPERYSDLFRSFRAPERARLYSPDFKALVADSDPLEHVKVAWESASDLRGVDRLLAVDVETYLPDDLLAKVDVASMAHSLETRSPLLDHHLMEFAASLPGRWKLRGRQGKALFRDAMRGWLPTQILDRPKQGFAVPLAEWFRNELRSVPEDVLLDPIAQRRGVFAPDEVKRLIAEHHSGLDRSRDLWGMVNLELWYQTCVDAVPATPDEVPTLT